MSVTCRSARLLALVLVVGLAACSEVLDPTRLEIATVTLEPAEATLEEGQEVQLQATLHAADGTVLNGRQVFWATEDSTVARVSASGLLSGVAVGTTRVAASSEGKHALATVRVQPPAVATVTLSPLSATITTTGTVQLTATLRDSRGNTLHSRSIAWSSSDSTVATVSGSGLVRGARPGTAAIAATSEGKSASATIQVTAGPPARVTIVSGNQQDGVVGGKLAAPLVVEVVDAGDAPVAGVRVDWSPSLGEGSLEPSFSTTGLNGRASTEWTLGFKPGEQRARARVGNLPQAEFRATARVGALQSIAVEPAVVQFTALRDTARLEAAGADEYGNPVPLNELTWLSLAPTVATVTPSGRVEAQSNGSALVVALADELADTARVEVAQVVNSVSVTPTSAALNPSQNTIQLAAAAADVNGFTVPGATLAWNSLDPGIASVNTGGFVTGISRGTARIRASAADKFGQATIEVVAGPPTAMRISSGNEQSGGVGKKLPQPLVVRLTDAGDAPVPGVQVQWSSTLGDGSLAPAASTTNANGRASSEWTLGIRPGQQRASARAGELSATFTAMAQVGPPHSVVVEPDQVQFAALHDTVLLHAEVMDEYGNPVASPALTWHSLSPAVASVGPNGLVEAQNNGSAPVVAAVNGLTDTAQVAVAQVIASVAVSPKSATLNAISHTVQLAGTAHDANGYAVAGAPLQWNSLDGGIASVGAGGLVTAIAPGSARIRVSSTGAADTSSVLVQQLIAAVNVTPPSETVLLLQTTQLSAAAVDAAGVPIPGVGFTWGSSNPTVASVDQTGLVRGLLPGAASITASSGGVSGASSISVELGIPASLAAIGGDAQTGKVGKALPEPLTVEVRDAANRLLAGISVAWSTDQIHGSLTPPVSTTDAQGRASAVWVPGVPAGAQRAYARVGSLERMFTATAHPPGFEGGEETGG